jgi:cyclic pyranopterin phosphate synthase
MPAEGLMWRKREELLSNDEIVRTASIMAQLGVRKLRLTGGEPTLRENLSELVSRLTGIPGIDTVSLTTNGVLFERHAKELKSAGLHGVNISLDSLSRETFARISRRDSLDQVMGSIEAAISEEFKVVKVNMVVMAGVNDHEMLDFVELARTKPLNLRFIEYMPFRGNRWDRTGMVTYDEMRGRIEAVHPLFALPETFVENRVSEDFQIPGFRGRVSLIASMTKSFCTACSRLRLTADGSLKACLFFPAQANLRGLLRSDATDEELAEMICRVVLQKPQGHPDPRMLEDLNDLSMIEIGG